ncbi:hypothetical protein [Paenibacillus xylanexedens]|uniref:hypothetical protein n=1 Tax=Paenibacillus xylanexedens TaxID=528191 RepID=UPI00119D6F80|nr:hypothetical protein [Paenibacillus xylanexedens]
MECTQGTSLAGQPDSPTGKQAGNLATVDTKKRPHLETALFILLFTMKKYTHSVLTAHVA